MANLKDLIVNGSARILGTIYGNVTGNVTGNVSGSSGSCTGNAATATKATADASGNNIVNTYATKTEVGGKQATLVSGTNIKTINSNSILGSGNLVLDGLPAQSGQSGKYLTTDGSSASWTEVNVSTYHPPILSCMWSDHLINDIQWLRADTFSWQSGDVYTTVYNKLVEEYNEWLETHDYATDYETEGDIAFWRTKSGFKICGAHWDWDPETKISNKYNTDGIAWYYILDTTNKRFKLPRTKFGFEGLRANVGDDIAESLPNIKAGNITIQDWGGQETQVTGAWGGSVVTNNNNVASGTTANEYTINFDASRSSSTYQDNAPVQERATQMYLYFYVGEYAQTAIEQTAGLNSELFNGKADVNTPSIQAPYLKTTYVNGTSGYNIWSNGYCEQWGKASFSSSTYVAVTVNLPKTMLNTNYNISIGGINKTMNGNYTFTVGNSITTSSFNIWEERTTGENHENYCCWKVSGYLASGQY